MRDMYIRALDEARRDRLELANTYFNLAVQAGKEGDAERADQLLRDALDQKIIVDGLERNINLLREA